MCVLDEQKLIDDAFNLAHKSNEEIIKTLESGAYRPAEKIILEKYLQKFNELIKTNKKDSFFRKKFKIIVKTIWKRK